MGKRATQRERVRAERAVLREAMEPDNPPYLRDRCQEFLEAQCWGNARCGGPSDDDIDRLVKFVVERPELRDRCRAFLRGEYPDYPWLFGYDGEVPDDDDVDKLVKFVVEELSRAGSIY